MANSQLKLEIILSADTNHEDVDTSFEDQEDQSLSSLKRKRKNDRRHSGDRIPLNKRTRKDDKRRFLVDSSDEEDTNHDTTAENTDLEENIENIAKLVRKSSTLKNKVRFQARV